MSGSVNKKRVQSSLAWEPEVSLQFSWVPREVRKELHPAVTVGSCSPLTGGVLVLSLCPHELGRPSLNLTSPGLSVVWPVSKPLQAGSQRHTLTYTHTRTPPTVPR